ncbi:hypothetical protein NKG05_03595 [Oerskovia sp. M15]
MIYACGSFTTSLAPNLGVLIFGWSVLEGSGRRSSCPRSWHWSPRTSPLRTGPARTAWLLRRRDRRGRRTLIGGLVTTYWTWRYVFAGEVVIVIVILLLTRKIADAPSAPVPARPGRCRALGPRARDRGVRRAALGEWGWVQPRPGGPSWIGLSPTIWLILAGLLIVRLFFAWEHRVVAAGKEPLVRPQMLRNAQLNGGLTMFFFQFMIQAGLFFTVPLYLSVALGLSALDTGIRLLPLSVTLLLAAVGIPRFFPGPHPHRRAVGRGRAAGRDREPAGGTRGGRGAEVVTLPLALAGLGVGALASQLGAVTVSAVPDEESGEVGGLQNTMTNLGRRSGPHSPGRSSSRA